MNEKITSMLTAISESRVRKYDEEVQRQKDAIETDLFRFLEECKGANDELKRANIGHQNKNTLWFNFELDAEVLPEVADFIDTEYQLNVDNNNKKKVYGHYEA